MGLISGLFGGSGASRVQRKIKSDEDSRKKITEMAEREQKAERIAKQHGVSISDARDFVKHEQQKEKGKENIEKIKSGLKKAQEWKKKHIVPMSTKEKKSKKSPQSPKFTFGSNKKAKPFVQWKRIK